MFECVRITQVHLNVFLIGAVNLIDKGGGGGGLNTDRCYKIYSKKKWQNYWGGVTLTHNN